MNEVISIGGNNASELEVVKLSLTHPTKGFEIPSKLIIPRSYYEVLTRTTTLASFIKFLFTSYDRLKIIST